EETFQSSCGPWVTDLRSPQVGFTRLAHPKCRSRVNPRSVRSLVRDTKPLVSRASVVSALARAERDPGPRTQRKKCEAHCFVEQAASAQIAPTTARAPKSTQ